MNCLIIYPSIHRTAKCLFFLKHQCSLHLLLLHIIYYTCICIPQHIHLIKSKLSFTYGCICTAKCLKKNHKNNDIPFVWQYCILYVLVLVFRTNWKQLILTNNAVTTNNKMSISSSIIQFQDQYHEGLLHKKSHLALKKIYIVFWVLSPWMGI